MARNKNQEPGRQCIGADEYKTEGYTSIFKRNFGLRKPGDSVEVTVTKKTIPLGKISGNTASVTELTIHPVPGAQVINELYQS